jgi:hypothetical protein
MDVKPAVRCDQENHPAVAGVEEHAAFVEPCSLASVGELLLTGHVRKDNKVLTRRDVAWLSPIGTITSSPANRSCWLLVHYFLPK